MTVKRYTLTQCYEHDGTYVTYSDYQKLVAENAALKQSEIEFDKMCAEEYGPDWVSEMTETPATDAAIAELRAQGADSVLRALVTSDDDDFTDAPAICANVAANLRAGRKG